MLGDAVNVASRLEQQTKGYGVDIIVGEETQRHTAHLAHLDLGVVRLRGKAQGMRMFFLAGGERWAEEAAFQALRTRHDEALAAFRVRDWEGARAGFEGGLQYCFISSEAQSDKHQNRGYSHNCRFGNGNFNKCRG